MQRVLFLLQDKVNLENMLEVGAMGFGVHSWEPSRKGIGGIDGNERGLARIVATGVVVDTGVHP
jgi:hypothetical protein